MQSHYEKGEKMNIRVRLRKGIPALLLIMVFFMMLLACSGSDTPAPQANDDPTTPTVDSQWDSMDWGEGIWG